MRFGPLLAAVLLVGAGAGTWIWIKETAATQQEPRGPGRRWAQGDGPVPVTAVPAAVADVPVWREGIGNVQALNTVTVRSQVDGKLLSVEFVEGQDVKKGQVLGRVDPAVYQAQLEQALAKKAQNEAALVNARQDLERAQKLMALNAGPKKTEDQTRAQVRQLEAQVRADEAAIDNARAMLGYTTITAHIDGRAGLRLVDAGNLLRGDSSAIVSIMQVSPISVVFTLPQRDLGVVGAALARGRVPVEILGSDGRSVVASGALATIDNQVDAATGTIRLKAEIPNEDRRLWPGQFVSARVIVDTLKGATVVPTAAIRRGPPGTFVYAVGPDRRATMRVVKVALENETQTVIAEGLEAGTEVVTVGFARLTDGKSVEVTTPGGSMPKGEARERRKGGASGGDPGAAADGERRRDRRDGEKRRRDQGSADSSAPAKDANAGPPATGARQ
jgi:multidrug efflux system membrane fusion protein